MSSESFYGAFFKYTNFINLSLMNTLFSYWH